MGVGEEGVDVKHVICVLNKNQEVTAFSDPFTSDKLEPDTQTDQFSKGSYLSKKLIR